MRPRRTERVNELLKRVLGEIILREAPTGGAGLISITAVEVAGDLHCAVVFVTVLGSEEQQRKAITWLAQERKHIQYLMAQAVILRSTPQLQFKLDTSILRGNRVLDIITELEKSGLDS
jgi:ribosome-binding factor A